MRKQITVILFVSLAACSKSNTINVAPTEATGGSGGAAGEPGTDTSGNGPGAGGGASGGTPQGGGGKSAAGGATSSGGAASGGMTGGAGKGGSFVPGTGTVQVGEACKGADDCAPPGVCMAGFCRTACAAATDCGAGNICLYDPDSKLSGCSLGSEATCTADQGCSNKAFTCGLDGRCRTACTDACVQNGAHCYEGACFDKTESQGPAPGIVQCIEEGRPAFACGGVDGTKDATVVTCNAPGKPGIAEGASCATAALCQAAAASMSETCPEPACDAGQARCNEQTLEVEACNEGRTAYEAVGPACASKKLCQDGAASATPACIAPACANPAAFACVEGNPYRCNASLTSVDQWDDCSASADGAQCNPQTAACASIKIDEREVSRADYEAFLTTIASAPPEQPQGCSWNTSFYPGDDAAWKVNNDGTLPVVDVDVCDAIAYCAAKQQHLCGKVGSGENITYNDNDDYLKPGVSEWTNGCTAGGELEYPYKPPAAGGPYQPQACNDGATGYDDAALCQGGVSTPCKGADKIAPKPVTSFASTCTPSLAGYKAINMAGNVAELELACSVDVTKVKVSTPADATKVKCAVRGGSYQDTLSDVAACAFKPIDAFKLNQRAATVGFRCCG